MKINRIVTISAMLLVGAVAAMAQGTLDDYNRAYSLREKFNAKHVYYSNVTPSWIGDSHSFWYVRETPEGRIYTLRSEERRVGKEC